MGRNVFTYTGCVPARYAGYPDGCGHFIMYGVVVFPCCLTGYGGEVFSGGDSDAGKGMESYDFCLWLFLTIRGESGRYSCYWIVGLASII